MSLQTKEDRLGAANTLLCTIAANGRKFFLHNNRVSYLTMDNRGRVWFNDAYTNERIYTHYKGEWRGFTEGGTLHYLIECLRDFITFGKKLPPRIFGPWPDWYCNGDLWGYKDGMQKVRDTAQRFDMLGGANKEGSNI